MRRYSQYTGSPIVEIRPSYLRNGTAHVLKIFIYTDYIDDLMQDWSNSIAKALELLQLCIRPSICHLGFPYSLNSHDGEHALLTWNSMS